jgi:hypothetical protein
MPHIPFVNKNPRVISQYAGKETNDCTVRAFANALNIPYEDAHIFMKKHCGRRRGTGIKGSVLKNLFDSKKDVIRKEFGVGIWEVNNINTINNLIKKKPNGTYYVLVRGHATAVVKGKLMDTTAKNWRIKKCWEVLHP